MMDARAVWPRLFDAVVGICFACTGWPAEASQVPAHSAPLSSLLFPVVGDVSRAWFSHWLLGAAATIVVVLAWKLALCRKVSKRTSRLHEMERRFTAILNSLPDLAWIKNLEGRDMAVCQSGQESAEAMVGRTDFDFFPPDTAEVFCRKDQAAADDDGSGRWVESTCAGTVGISRDVTTRSAEDALSHALHSLRQSEGRFRDLVRAFPVGLVETDADGAVTFVNELARRMLGINGGGQGDRSWQRLVHPADRAKVAAGIRKLIEDGVDLDMECRIARDRAAPVWTHVRGVCRAGTGGALISLLDISARKEAEESLRAREEEFRALAELSPDTIARYDLDCRRLYANPAFSAAAGVPAPELLGKTPSETIGPELGEPYEAALREVARTGGAGQFELTWRTFDGHSVISDIRLAAERGEDGKVESVIAIGRDVTRQKAVEAELRLKSGRLGALLDHLPGIAYRKEYGIDDSHITYISAGYRALMGYDFDGWAQQDRLRRIWHPEDHDKVLAYGQAIRNGDVFAEVKLRFIHADGSVRWVLLRECVVERSGDFIAAEGMMFDITEEVRAKEALTNSLEELWATSGKLQTLLGNMPGFVFRMEYFPDNSKRIMEAHGELVNPKILESAAALRATVHPDDMHLAYDELAERLRADGYAEQIFRTLAPDGRVRWVHTRERVVERLGDRMIVEGQALDVTTEVQVRQDLEESERRLRRAETRLQQGRRLEALGQFAGGIAHDFNNLLGAMLGYARFISEDAPPASDSKRHADRIIAAGDRGRAIVDQILDYSCKTEMQISRFRLGELIADVVSLCAADCRPGIVLDPDLSLADVEIQADRVHLTRLLMNLCGNALDAMDGGSGSIAIGAHQSELDPVVLHRLVERDETGDGGDVETWTDDEGVAWALTGRLPRVLPHICLFVADTGCGMEAKHLESAFAPFFTTKDRTKGTGLGLAVVHGVVMAHGGALIGSSRPGKGTRFDVLLPLSRSAVEAATVFAPVAEARKTNLLVVDDNVDVLDAMVEALSRVDFPAEGFSDPNAGLAAFESSPEAWDAVVTDQIMPGLRGAELIQRIRAIRPEIPCILCTGYMEDIDQAACAAAGISQILRKPVGMRELVQAIERQTERKSTEA